MANARTMQFYIEEGTIKTSYAKDSRLKKKEIEAILKEQLGDNYKSIKFKKYQKVLTGYYENDNKKTFLMLANITFMGGLPGQHPSDLKRIQYNSDWRDFYDRFKDEGKVIWMGIYSYKGVNVFGAFEPDTYLKKHEGKKMTTKTGEKSNYSCHIYLNDLLQGYENGVFEKKDKNDNHIYSIASYALRNFFEDEYKDNPIVALVKKINKEKIDWGKWISANKAIPYLRKLKKKTGFNQWKQNLWNGFFVEGLYCDYLYDKPSSFVEYIGTTNNKKIREEYAKYILDLAFPDENYHFIGDLKGVCDGYGQVELNDEHNVKQALKKYGKIWFIIYIHEKKPGKTNNYEMVKWRNQYIRKIGEWKKNKPFDELSACNTPHSIKFTEMVIVELNEITKKEYFSIIKQRGDNSDGKVRNDEFAISKKDIKRITDDRLVIYRERHSSE